MTAKKMRRRQTRQKRVSKATPARQPQRAKFLPKKANSLQARLVIVWLVLFGSIFSLIARVFYLQIIDYSTLKGYAQEQQEVTLRPYIPRRTIIDRHNNALAVDHIVYSLYIHPNGFTLPPKLREDTPDYAKTDPSKYVAYHLASALPDTDAAELEQTFRTKDSGILLTHQLDNGIAQDVRKLNLDGVELVNRFGRFYPQKETAAEVIGYVDFDHIGQAGIEYTKESLIEREPIVLQLTRSGNGSLLPANLEAGVLKYDDWQLKLTIDLPLQRAAREALKKQMAAYDGKRGAVIVMDAHTGEVLTLVTEPTYDPNRYFETDYELFKNWTVADLYEPGSTFKPLNVAIALDAGVITPETVVYDSGRVMIDTWPISNHDYAQRGGHGYVDVAKILRVSSNVGMIQLMRNLKVSDYYEKLVKLQIDQKTGIDLPGEAAGYIKDRETFTAGKIEAATSSFGQGFSLTPLKLVQLHAALANGGYLVQPHVVQGLVDSQGQWQTLDEAGNATTSDEPTSTPRTRIFSAESAKEVVEMMETVVADGSGKSSQIEGYRIGGKTGTAQKADRGVYIVGAKITSFVSVFPVENPKYVVMAIVDEPKAKDSYGSTVTAPIVRDVLEVLIAKEAIAPYSPPSPAATSD
ncbi:MAG: penicillin-binding protein 2 [Limnothrix sp.]